MEIETRSPQMQADRSQIIVSPVVHHAQVQEEYIYIYIYIHIYIYIYIYVKMPRGARKTSRGISCKGRWEKITGEQVKRKGAVP
jgi:hypothetical protein